jgi:hypothetical protein
MRMETVMRDASSVIFQRSSKRVLPRLKCRRLEPNDG